jgi:hypothetical protein
MFYLPTYGSSLFHEKRGKILTRSSARRHAAAVSFTLLGWQLKKKLTSNKPEIRNVH